MYSSDQLYQALVNKDQSLDGLYYAAVKTTGIFCKMSCRARKPLAQNVLFYTSVKEALDHGFRPCKVCSPMQLSPSTPDAISKLLQEVHEYPEQRIRDQQLREKGLDPVWVRRWFQKNYAMSFHAYQRSLRLNLAFGHLKNGEPIHSVSYDGFESLSGFTSAFRKRLGFNPSESGDKKVIHVTRLDTPIGPMMAGATDEGIALLEFTDRRMLERQCRILNQRTKRPLLPGNHHWLHKLQAELQAYFDGKLESFSVPLYTPGSPFQNLVWDRLQSIPYGDKLTYQQLASQLNNPKAVRAVARANGDNRISILIPCHRVIGSDGRLTGYGGGLWRKQYLLDLESSK